MAGGVPLVDGPAESTVMRVTRYSRYGGTQHVRVPLPEPEEIPPS